MVNKQMKFLDNGDIRYEIVDEAARTGLASKITSPITSGTEGQVLTIDANGNPIWDNTSSDMSNYYTKSEINEMIPENNLTNIVDGSASGSVRGINTKSEDSSYKMGNNAWAEGLNTMASGESSHAQGMGTIASKNAQSVLGTYNIEDTSTTAVHPRGDVDLGQYAVIVGNGYADTTNKEVIRSNAHTLDWQGNGWYAGKLTVGSAPTASMDVATKKYVDDSLSGVSVENADWSENDPTSNTYIENRTHYVEDPVITEVLTYSSEDSSTLYSIPLTDTDLELEEGTAYTIVLNGITYTGNFVLYEQVYIAGNGYLISQELGFENTEEPFALYIMPNQGAMLIMQEAPSSGVNLSLSLSITTIHKLDSKFLDGSLILSGEGVDSEIFNGNETTAIYYITVSGDANATTYTIDSGVNEQIIFKLQSFLNYISIREYKDIQINAISTSTLKLTSTLDENNNISNKNLTLTLPSKIASGNYSHVEGKIAWASGEGSHAEGLSTMALNNASHSEGGNTTASGSSSHAEGWSTRASGDSSHAEGKQTKASGEDSHAEGYSTTASGKYSHAEGYSTTASALEAAHAEGYSTTASGKYSHAEGSRTKASEDSSHAEGYSTTASKQYSHAEGCGTTASEDSSHAEGYSTTASGKYSHAEGRYTIAQRQSQHVFGEYNITDTNGTQTTKGNYIEIVGNGTSQSARSNARTLDWSGNEVLAGKLTVGSNPTASMDVATKQYVDGVMSRYALKSEIPTVTNDFTDGYKDKVDSLWEDYQDALTALG